jgi:hypothetical protein
MIPTIKTKNLLLRENTFINGRWENDILMSILKDEYRDNYAKK